VDAPCAINEFDPQLELQATPGESRAAGRPCWTDCRPFLTGAPVSTTPASVGVGLVAAAWLSASSVTPDLHPTWRYGPSSSNIERTKQHTDLGKLDGTTPCVPTSRPSQGGGTGSNPVGAANESPGQSHSSEWLAGFSPLVANGVPMYFRGYGHEGVHPPTGRCLGA
jgi:hypothetical protein